MLLAVILRTRLSVPDWEFEVLEYKVIWHGLQALALAKMVIVSYGHWHVLAQPKWTLVHQQSDSAGLRMSGRLRGAGGSVFFFSCGKPGVATGASGRSDAKE